MKALVFSGGASKIHYHVGAARILLGVENDYALFAGVSAGAIVAAYLAQFPRKSEAVAIHSLQRMTEHLTSDDVFEGWVFGRIQGLWSSSFYSSSPLRDLLRRELDLESIRKNERKLRIGAVSLETGQFFVFDEHCKMLHAAIMASAAFPGFLDPVRLYGQTLIDGGVRSYTPISTAIAAGATEIDIVIASPSDPDPMPTKKHNALQVMLRAFDIMCDEISDKDLKLADAYNALVKAGVCPDRKLLKIRVIRPKTELDIEMWDFGAKNAAVIQERGASDALRVLKL